MSVRMQDELERINRQISAEIRHFQDVGTIQCDTLLAFVLEGEQCLGALRQTGSEASSRVEFRDHLKRLATMLPGVYTRLLVNRTRLERARTHLDGAIAWANSNKKSL
jgi:hypothetical protein